MTPEDRERWRGLKDLLTAGIEHGASAIERVHRETARRPFTLLARVPTLAGPARGVQLAHDAFVAAGYGSVRAVTRGLAVAADFALDTLAAGEGPGNDHRLDADLPRHLPRAKPRSAS